MQVSHLLQGVGPGTLNIGTLSTHFSNQFLMNLGGKLLSSYQIMFAEENFRRVGYKSPHLDFGLYSFRLALRAELGWMIRVKLCGL